MTISLRGYSRLRQMRRMRTLLLSEKQLSRQTLSLSLWTGCYAMLVVLVVDSVEWLYLIVGFGRS